MRRAPLPRSFTFALFLLLATTAAPVAAEEVTRTFDVGDLLLQVPNFTDAPKLGVRSDNAGGIEEAADDATLTRRELVDGLVGWLQKAVKTDERATTSIGIDEQGKLRLKGEKETVARLTRLVEVQRRSRATQITVEARTVTVGADLVDLTDGDVAEKLLTAMSPGRPAVPLTDADVKAVLRAIQASSAGSVVTAPRITLFDRQRAYVLVANDRAFVASHSEMVANGKRSTEPNIEVVSTGVVHDVRGTADKDGRTVALELRFQWARLLEMKEETKPGLHGQPLQVQVPVIESLKQDRTIVLPDGGTVLTYLGDVAASLDDDGKADAAKGGPPAGDDDRAAKEPVFLLVRATVVKTPVTPIE